MPPSFQRELHVKNKSLLKSKTENIVMDVNGSILMQNRFREVSYVEL